MALQFDETVAIDNLEDHRATLSELGCQCVVTYPIIITNQAGKTEIYKPAIRVMAYDSWQDLEKPCLT